MPDEIDSALRVIGVSLTSGEIAIVNRHVEQTGLGPKGFSAGLRQIIRAWAEQNIPQPQETKSQEQQPS